MTSHAASRSPVQSAQSIFRAAVRRVQADQLIDESEPDGWAPRPFDTYDAVRVVGMGKAAMGMAGVLDARWARRIEGGTVVVPDGYPETYPDRLPQPSAIRVMEGGHPTPTDGSARAGRRLLEQARATDNEDLLLVLVSGGGTAVSTLPVEALDVHDLKTVYRQLMTAGVPIGPTNVVRKHLTQVGGGQLAQAAQPGHVGALVVSDVVGNDLATIASGPTVPDPSTFEDAMQVLYRYGLWHEVPAPVREHVAEGARGRRSETPAPGDPSFENTQTTLLGANETALDAARAAAEEHGYRVEGVATGVEGDAATVAREHVRTLMTAAPDVPTCWLWGGETTVTVTGDGTGGRNQEGALAAALALDEHEGRVVFLSGGTDGVDGPTDAAGAWATPDTAETARRRGLDPEGHLERNDAYPFFDALDQLLRPGPTHTNVMDVQIGIVDA